MINLSSFSHKQLEELKDIVTNIIEHELPVDFYNDNTYLMADSYTDSIYIANENYKIAFLNNNGELKIVYKLNCSDRVGFLEELIEDFENGYIDINDYNELAHLCEINGKNEMAKKIRNKIKRFHDRLCD